MSESEEGARFEEEELSHVRREFASLQARFDDNMTEWEQMKTRRDAAVAELRYLEDRARAREEAEEAEQGEGTVARLRNRVKGRDAEIKILKARVVELDGLLNAPENSDRFVVACKPAECGPLTKAQIERDKVEEELAHVRRELAEMRGQDAAEETSETLAIYESYKTALEPFGHKHLNVRGRIEMLVEEWKNLHKPREVDQVHVRRVEIEIERWRTACKTAQVERLRLIRAVLGIPHPQSFPKNVGDPFEAAMELCEQANLEIAEETTEALVLLGDALIQLQNAGVSTFLLKPKLSDGVKRDLIRVLHLSMGEEVKCPSEAHIIAEAKLALGIALDAPDDTILGDLNLIVEARKRLTEFLVQCTDEYGEDEEEDVQDAAIRTLRKLAEACPDQKIVELSGKGDTCGPGGMLSEAERHLRESTDRQVVQGLTAVGVPIRKPGVGIGVVCVQDGHILLGKRHPDIDGGGQWGLPGGSVEWGESWEAAGRREVREETGIIGLQNYRFLTAKADYRPEDAKHNAIIFVRFDAKGNATVKEPDKCLEWGWYLLDKLPEGPMFLALRELLTVDRHLLA